jgi:hypothetical protein
MQPAGFRTGPSAAMPAAMLPSLLIIDDFLADPHAARAAGL